MWCQCSVNVVRWILDLWQKDSVGASCFYVWLSLISFSRAECCTNLPLWVPILPNDLSEVHQSSSQIKDIQKYSFPWYKNGKDISFLGWMVMQRGVQVHGQWSPWILSYVTFISKEGWLSALWWEMPGTLKWCWNVLPLHRSLFIHYSLDILPFSLVLYELLTGSFNKPLVNCNKFTA